MKKKCPFCGVSFVTTPEKDFYAEHLKDCEKRTPPNTSSQPITEKLTTCEKCGGSNFQFIHRYSYRSGFYRSLWEYACKDCGQRYTALNSIEKIAAETPYNLKITKKPTKWEKR